MIIELEAGGACMTHLKPLGIRIGFRNQGGSATGPFVVDVNGNEQTFAGGLAGGASGQLWFGGYVYPGNNVATVDATSLVVESDETNNTHTKTPAIPTPPVTCTPPLPTDATPPFPSPTPTKQPHPADLDSDGCSDQRESGPVPELGGLRNHTHFWDFFDTPNASNLRDSAISGLDFFAVLSRFGATGAAGIDPLSAPPAAPAYHTAFDRGLSFGPNVWNVYPADGSITGTDFFTALGQFGHACA
jgi:hypothetical protein